MSIALCSDCAGYEPLTPNGAGDYRGALFGECFSCGRGREVHHFGVAVDISVLGPCECRGGHLRRETC